MREIASLSRSITDRIATAIGATVTGGVMVTSVTMTATATATALVLSSDSDTAITDTTVADMVVTTTELVSSGAPWAHDAERTDAIPNLQMDQTTTDTIKLMAGRAHG